MQSKIKNFVETKNFQTFIIGLIVFNAILLGVETSKSLMLSYGFLLQGLDDAILVVFIIEILLKLFAYRLKFFVRPWCVFDLAIIIIAVMPASGAFSVLRALRVLRVLRLISTIPSMRKVVEGLINAIPGILSVSSLMGIFFYIFSVIGTKLYAETFPQFFGTLGESMFTLFQVMTLESWSMGVARPVIEEHPNAWVFFMCYIIVTTFTMLNLFIAIIVNAMSSDSTETAANDREEIKREIKGLEEKLLKEFRKKK